MTATDYLVWGALAHMIADWILQDDWMARNKACTGRTEPMPARRSDVLPGRVLVDPDDRRWVVRQADHGALDCATLCLEGRPVDECWARIPDVVATHTVRRPAREGWRHPASYVHATIHLVALLFVFPWAWALGIAVSHWFVDLRFALAWWRRAFGQTVEGPAALHVAVWGDQVVHLAVLGAAARCLGGPP